MPDLDGLRALAQEQGGAFTIHDATRCGWTEHAIRRAVRTSAWTRLHPGVLAESEWLDGLDLTARHLAQLHARLLHRPQGWHAARRTAALVHGLPIIGKPPKVPQLVRDKTTLGLRGSVRHERVSTLPESERVDAGVPATSLARTVADIARDECFRNAVVVADAALRAGAPPEELLHVARRCATWPGGSALRPVVSFANGLAETPLESISRVAVHELGLPAPELQVEIWLHDTFLARVDFLWRAFNVVGEADGRSKYVSVQDLYAEKRREERLRDAGFEVPRWDWDMAYRPGPAFRATLQRSFERGALNRLAPGVRLIPTAASRRAA